MGPAKSEAESRKRENFGISNTQGRSLRVSSTSRKVAAKMFTNEFIAIKYSKRKTNTKAKKKKNEDKCSEEESEDEKRNKKNHVKERYVKRKYEAKKIIMIKKL